MVFPRWYLRLAVFLDMALFAACLLLAVVLLILLLRRQWRTFWNLYLLWTMLLVALGLHACVAAILLYYPLLVLALAIRGIAVGTAWLTLFFLWFSLPVFLRFKTSQQYESLLHSRDQALGSLVEEWSRFNNIARLSATAVILANQEGQIIFWNEAARRKFGYAPAEILGQELSVLVPPSQRQAYLRSFAAVVRGERPLRFAENWTEVEAVRKNGTTFPAELALGSWRSAQGELVFLGLVHDISRRKHYEEELARANQELRRSNEDLQQFAATASHDLREPLRTVASYIQLLETRHADLPLESKQLLATMVAAVTRMQALIDDILSYTQVATSTPSYQLISLDSALLAARTALDTAFCQTGAQLVCPVPLPMVYGDLAQLTQVFQNLLANAIKFTREGVAPVVTVTCALTPQEITVSVTDNGVGIAPPQWPRLFQMFQRLWPRSRYPGTGIGLALCRRIIERHGGTLRIVASAPGQGSTFAFTLPQRVSP
jgi:PAS domain S-box-containing protein